MYLCKQEHGFSVFLRVCNLDYYVPLSLHMYKSMFRPEVIRRIELCFFQSCAKLPSLPRASEIHHVAIPVERSTSVYINLVRCVYHRFQPCAGSEPDCNCCLSNKYTYMQLWSPKV